MKKIIILIAMVFMFLPTVSWASRFPYSVAINIQELQVYVPSSSQTHSLKLKIYLKGKTTGHWTLVDEVNLGHQPANQPIASREVTESIEIPRSYFEMAIDQGGLLGQDASGYDLAFKIQRYRTFADKTHLSFSLPLSSVNNRGPIAVADAGGRNYVAMDLAVF